MNGLGKYVIDDQSTQSIQLKTQGKIHSRRKSLLSNKEPASGFRESAAVHFVQLDLTSFSNEFSESDNDLAVVSTVEMLSVVGSDGPTSVQEKEARSSGGIPSR